MGIMDYNILLLFLIGHFLGDYYFQTDMIARNKNLQLAKLLKHCVLYSFAMLIVIIPVFSLELLICSGAISVMHFIVDFIKSHIKNREKNNSRVYFADQVIHIIVILILSVFISQNIIVSYTYSMKNLLALFNINDLKMLSFILAFLIIMKPSSITIKIILAKYGNFQKENEGVPNTGALIGELERVIILLMLTQSQYAAVGFILTAKSVVRYKRIVDEINFSEYYLLGTFLSTLIVILTYLVVFLPFFG
jgi:hypothetical protein